MERTGQEPTLAEEALTRRDNLWTAKCHADHDPFYLTGEQMASDARSLSQLLMVHTTIKQVV